MSTQRRQKKVQLKMLKPKQYRIYGIFNFKNNRLVYVTMDQEQSELEFDIGDYDVDQYDVVAFNIMLA